jgi:hypothetical protein
MKKYLLLILLLGNVVMIVVMTKTGATLKTPATPKGILDLEFAYNTSKAAIVTTAWAGDNTGAAKINTYLDFIFLLFYSLFLFFTCDKIARITKSKAGTLIANGAMYAGILDIVENAGMLMTLSGNTSGTVTFLTAACSIIKWVLALGAAVYCLGGFIYIITQKKLKLLLA